MRPVTQRLSAAGFAPWIPMNRLQWTTNAGLSVELSSGASLTYSVQQTSDDLYKEYTDFTGSRTTTTVTITQVNHGLSVGDWAFVKNAGGQFDGMYRVAAITDADNFTYTVSNTGISTAGPNASLQKARIVAHPVLSGLTATAASTQMSPVTASRLLISTYSSGFADFTILQGN